MNNEPVAWMYAVNGIWTAFSDEIPPDDAYDEGTLTPLYTHPAKTLTDEEILDICIVGGFYDRIDDPFFDKKTGAWSLDEDLIEFARAILRKAQSNCNGFCGEYECKENQANCKRKAQEK